MPIPQSSFQTHCSTALSHNFVSRPRPQVHVTALLSWLKTWLTHEMSVGRSGGSEGQMRQKKTKNSASLVQAPLLQFIQFAESGWKKISISIVSNNFSYVLKNIVRNYNPINMQCLVFLPTEFDLIHYWVWLVFVCVFVSVVFSFDTWTRKVFFYSFKVWNRKQKRKLY